MKRLKIAIVQRVFTIYRKPIFDILSDKYCLKVFHSSNNSGITQVKTKYSQIVKSIKYSKKDTAIWLFITKPFIRFKPKVIIHEFTPSILSLHISYLFTLIFSVKFIIWGHGYSKKRGFNPKKSIISKIRLWYLKKANAVLLYSNERKIELSKFIPADKIFVAQNTLDTKRLTTLKKEFDLKGKDSIKNELGINYKYNLIFIGRLLKDKYPNLLINLFNSLDPIMKENTAIHIIGDGELFKEMKDEIIANNLNNNIFLYGKIDNTIHSGKFLYISDLLINPGYLGLSINHAFCFGIPVVSFVEGENGPFHSPEIEYLVSGKTGYLAKNMDLIDMKDFIVKYLNDKELREKMKNNIEFCVNNICSIENMISGFDKAINYCLKKK